MKEPGDSSLEKSISVVDQTDEEMEKSIAEAIDQGLMRMADIRSPIKQGAKAAKIIIAVPMGDKDDPDLFVCPKCGLRHFGVVKCGKCGNDHSARQKLRHAGLAPVEWLLNAWQLVPPLLTSLQIIIRKSILSGQARNEMTYQAIKIGSKYIFYWDDDVIIPPKALYDLHNMMERTPEAGIISGVYTTREECPEPIYYKEEGQGAYWNMTMERGVLEEIYGAGAGCMIARIEALEDVKKLLGGPWWADEQDLDAIDKGTGKVLWGHDIRFCQRMRDTGQHPEAKKPWKVYGAGWILCYHFDLMSQTLYGMPHDAPCLHNKNTPTYWDHVWAASGFAVPENYRDMYNSIAARVLSDSNVVDVGCGNGVLMEMLLKKLHVRTYGYDIAPKAVDATTDRWLEAETLDVADWSLNHFNAGETTVVCCDTLQHFDAQRINKFLYEARLAQRVIISVPNGRPRGAEETVHLQAFDAGSLWTLLDSFFEKVYMDEAESGFLVAVCSGGKEREDIACPSREICSGSVPAQPPTSQAQSTPEPTSWNPSQLTLQESSKDPCPSTQSSEGG